MKIFKTILTGWLPSMMSSLWAAMVLPRYLHYFAMVRVGRRGVGISFLCHHGSRAPKPPLPLP